MAKSYSSMASAGRAAMTDGDLPIAVDRPLNTARPVITGTAAVGQTLSVNNGSWNVAISSYAYEWRADTVPIAGATANTYVLTANEAGKEITCSVKAILTADVWSRHSSMKTARVTNGALGPAVAPVMMDLSPGTKIADITGLTPGEFVTSISPNDGRLALNAAGTRLIKGLSAITNGTINATLQTSYGRSLSMMIGTYTSGGQIALSTNAIDDNAVAGTTIGALSMVGFGAGPWTYSLSNNAGAMFDVSSANLVTGATALNHDTAPTPQITVQATDGILTVQRVLTMNVRKPLPALPLVAGSTMNLVGHSILAYNHSASSLNAADVAALTCSQGFLSQYYANDPRFNIDQWWDGVDLVDGVGSNFAAFGGHIDAMQIQLDGALAHKPAVVGLMIASNTIATGDGGVGIEAANLEYCKTSLLAMIKRCRDAGVWALVFSEITRGVWIADGKHTDAEKNAAISAFSTFVTSLAGMEGVKVVDWRPFTEPGGVQDLSVYGIDQVHFSPYGAAKAAKFTPFVTTMESLFASGERFSSDPTTGDQLVSAANYNFLATASAVSGQITGTKAASMVNFGSGGQLTPPTGGSTVVASLEQIGSTGRYKQVLDITPADNGSGLAYHALGAQLGISAITGLAAGDWVMGSLILELEGSENLGMYRLMSTVQQSSTVRARTYVLNTSSDQFVGKCPIGVRKLITMPIQIPAGQTFDRLQHVLQLFWNRAAVGAFRVKFHSQKWTKITDPRILRGY